jgi:hypothetical protein
VIEEEVKAKRDVVCICLDVKNYYYSIDVKRVYEMVSIACQKHTDVLLNDLFFKTLFVWSDIFSIEKTYGIPVGLTASPFIANIALIDFDKLVHQTFQPLSYGRYVDDILIVLPGSGFIKTPEDFFNRLAQQSPSDMIKKPNDGKKKTWGWKELLFSTKKCSFRRFSGKRSEVELGLFRRQLGERTSEWRSLPDISSEQSVYCRLLSIVDAKNEPVVKLRDFNDPTLCISSFSMMLRDCEALGRTFYPEQWSETRKAFLTAFTDFCVTPKKFFVFEKYLSRVLSLGVLCEDYHETANLLNKIAECLNAIGEKSMKCPPLKTGEKKQITALYQKYLADSIAEVFLRCNPVFDMERLKKLMNNECRKSMILKEIPSSISDYVKSYFCADLGYFPFKWLFAKEGASSTALRLYPYDSMLQELEQNLSDEKNGRDVLDLLETENRKKQYANKTGTGGIIAHGGFLTRTFSVYDFSFFLDGLDDSPIQKNWEKSVECIKQYRQYEINSQTGNDKMFHEWEHDRLLSLPQNGKYKSEISIAVANIRLEETELDRQVKGLRDDTEIEKYMRFTSVVNEVIHCPKHIDYLLFPELAIPPDWFMGAANKLQKKGINFISGVTYRIENGKVSNETWMSLNHTCFKYHAYVVLKQQKQIPAYQELQQLQTAAGLVWEPEKGKLTKQWPPIIRHGDMFFAVLICSELMNIDYRSRLRGKIDCLFLPEWNKDITYYNDLINSSANDLHAFMVQCNNNKYGDSRIRGPYDNDYDRDIVKSKGGINDYFIVGTIGVEALRRFQMNATPPPKEAGRHFKPFPIGFIMSEERKEALKEV